MIDDNGFETEKIELIKRWEHFLQYQGRDPIKYPVKETIVINEFFRILRFGNNDLDYFAIFGFRVFHTIKPTLESALLWVLVTMYALRTERKDKHEMYNAIGKLLEFPDESLDSELPLG